ncbi:MAG: hypothetical protein EOP05_06865 [Proteobacteria bacterium]|nr:MAG: hypothetical protein EOP05_06865 [Pseudomonadota bacterium]
MILVLREGSALRPKSRALVWCKIRSGDDGVVAFVWPPMMPTQNKLDIRFFKDGRRISLLEPLAGKLETLVEMVKQQGSALIGKNAIRIGYAPRGVFVGCRLSRRIFEAPVSESLLNEDSFAHWETDAVLPLSFEIRSNVNAVF